MPGPVKPPPVPVTRSARICALANARTRTYGAAMYYPKFHPELSADSASALAV